MLRPRLLWILLAAAMTLPALAQRNRPDNAPAVGAEAPDFDLARMIDHETREDDRVQLASICEERPVVLIFGSYT